MGSVEAPQIAEVPYNPPENFIAGALGRANAFVERKLRILHTPFGQEEMTLMSASVAKQKAQQALDLLQEGNTSDETLFLFGTALSHIKKDQTVEPSFLAQIEAQKGKIVGEVVRTSYGSAYEDYKDKLHQDHQLRVNVHTWAQESKNPKEAEQLYFQALDALCDIGKERSYLRMEEKTGYQVIEKTFDYQIPQKIIDNWDELKESMQKLEVGLPDDISAMDKMVKQQACVNELIISARAKEFWQEYANSELVLTLEKEFPTTYLAQEIAILAQIKDVDNMNRQKKVERNLSHIASAVSEQALQRMKSENPALYGFISRYKSGVPLFTQETNPQRVEDAEYVSLINALSLDVIQRGIAEKNEPMQLFGAKVLCLAQVPFSEDIINTLQQVSISMKDEKRQEVLIRDSLLGIYKSNIDGAKIVIAAFPALPKDLQELVLEEFPQQFIKYARDSRVAEAEIEELAVFLHIPAADITGLLTVMQKAIEANVEKQLQYRMLHSMDAFILLSRNTEDLQFVLDLAQFGDTLKDLTEQQVEALGKISEAERITILKKAKNIKRVDPEFVYTPFPYEVGKFVVDTDPFVQFAQKMRHREYTNTFYTAIREHGKEQDIKEVLVQTAEHMYALINKGQESLPDASKQQQFYTALEQLATSLTPETGKLVLYSDFFLQSEVVNYLARRPEDVGKLLEIPDRYPLFTQLLENRGYSSSELQIMFIRVFQAEDAFVLLESFELSLQGITLPWNSLIINAFGKYESAEKSQVYRDSLRAIIERTHNTSIQQAADARNREFARAFFLGEKDLVHGGNTDNLSSILELGLLSGDFFPEQHTLNKGGNNNLYSLHVAQLGNSVEESETPVDARLKGLQAYERIKSVPKDKKMLLLLRSGLPVIPGATGGNHKVIETGTPATDIQAIFLEHPDEELAEVVASVAKNPFYIPVFDFNGTLLLTPEAYDDLRKPIHEFMEYLSQADMSPAKAMVLLEKISPEIETLYEDTTPIVSEGYSLKEHTIRVEQRFADSHEAAVWNEEAYLLSKDEFRLLLFLHDCGKVSSAQSGGEKFQHEENLRIGTDILQFLPLNLQKKAIIRELISHDYLGQYLNAAIGRSFEETVKGIRDAARRLEVSPVSFLRLLTKYYECDAGSYDRLLPIFQTNNSGQIIGFSPAYQGKYALLEQAVAQGIN